MQEKENDEKIIEMVKECTKEDDEKEPNDNSKTEESVKKGTNEQEINVSVGEQPLDENEIILKFHDDFCTIRRDMISEHIMEREGSIYVLK